MISVSQSKQLSHTPRGSDAEHRHERHADETPADGTFAPALEHGNHSNEEQHDCGRGKNLQQHD
jgi:hypothetical protein